MSKLIKKIYVIRTEDEYGENCYVFGVDKNLIKYYHCNDLYITGYTVDLLESLGHDVEISELEDMFEDEQSMRKWLIDLHGYDAYSEEEDDDDE